MKTSQDYSAYLARNREDIGKEHMRIDKALIALLTDKSMNKADVIARSCIENHYAYQIFNGKKTPSRDKVVMLCYGFSLSVEEAQQLLKISGYAQLYIKDSRDNVLLFGLTKALTVIEVNCLLYELGLALLV